MDEIGGEVFGKKRFGWRGVADVVAISRISDRGGGCSGVGCDAALQVVEALGIEKTS